MALRRRNLIAEAALPYANPFGMTYDSGAYEAILDRTLALADWDGFEWRREEARGRGRTEQFAPVRLATPIEPGVIAEVALVGHDGRELIAA